MEAWREPAGASESHAMSTSAVAFAETVSLYCRTCSARFSFPAPSSPFLFTLCPRCRQDYLDDSSTRQLVLLPPPPPPPPILPPPSTTSTLRSSTTAETMSSSVHPQFIFSPSGSDFESPLGPPSPPPPPPVFAYDATFDTPLQRGGSQAAPAESIAALPTVTVTDAALVCPICTDPILASAPARLLPCGHLHHSDCIVTWLSLRNSCPVCRGSIPMFHSAADIASSPPPSLRPTSSGRRRSLPGTRRIRRICSRLLRRIEISRDRRTDSSGHVHV